MLLAGFEAVAAYHFGVERIGRYLQVFYEQRLRNPGEPDAQWEGIAMDLGHLRPTPTGDPLFSAVFSCATLLNVLPVLRAGSTRWQATGIGVVHGLFLARILLVRRRAAGQRQRERTLFEQLAARSREALPQTGERAMS